MYTLPNIIETLDMTYNPLGEDTISAIDTLRSMFEMAEYFEVDYSNEERTLFSVENETDEELIKAVVEGLYEDVQGKVYNR